MALHIEYQEYDGCHNCKHMWKKKKDSAWDNTMFFCDAAGERPNEGTYDDCVWSFEDERFPYTPASGTEVYGDWLEARDKYAKSQLELFQTWAEKHAVKPHGVCPLWK